MNYTIEEKFEILEKEWLPMIIETAANGIPKVHIDISTLELKNPEILFKTLHETGTLIVNGSKEEKIEKVSFERYLQVRNGFNELYINSFSKVEEEFYKKV